MKEESARWSEMVSQTNGGTVRKNVVATFGTCWTRVDDGRTTCRQRCGEKSLWIGILFRSTIMYRINTAKDDKKLQEDAARVLSRHSNREVDGLEIWRLQIVKSLKVSPRQ